MIIVELKGGLGNQMFQYAAASALTNTGEKVILDHHFLNENNTDSAHFTARKYELIIFRHLKAKEVLPYQRKLFRSPEWYYKLQRLAIKPFYKYIKQISNEYISFSGFINYKFIYLEGYFQSEKYFKSIRKLILDEFRFPDMDLKNERFKQQIIDSDHAVSLHIRRGDYLKSSVANVHPALSLNYYEKAINLLSTKYTISLFIFSDDMRWTKENITVPNVRVNYVDQNNSANSWKDMALMSCCRHHIIANSSFSWWGAWLSETKGDVIAPCNWFNKTIDYNINDFIPAGWTIIDDE